MNISKRPFFKQPFGLLPFLSVLLTLIVLSAMLGTMVWSRVSLLQNGTQIVLKTAPIDPRDLLRGYYVRLNYDISRISLADLVDPISKDDFENGFKSHSNVFVKLQPDTDGFWSPVSIHRTMPDSAPSQAGNNQTAIIRGYLKYRSCSSRFSTIKRCKLSLRYGIEKFFAAKQRSKKLEDFGREASPEIQKINKQIKKLQDEYQVKIRELRQQAGAPGNRQVNRKIQQRPEIKELSKRLRELRSEVRKLTAKNRKGRAKRFAVIARVDKKTGEVAISGLQLDGQRIYDEPLF
jgi:uncharacterized membrane-anchored protein